jgi:hypothetical protein
VLRGWFASLRLLTDDLLRYRAGSPLHQLTLRQAQGSPLARLRDDGRRGKVKDDAPSFSFFQNIVSKEQDDDKSSLFLKAHWKKIRGGRFS